MAPPELQDTTLQALSGRYEPALRLVDGRGAVSSPAHSPVGDLVDAVDDLTRGLLLGRSGGLPRRGWVVRRALLAADLLGLSAAFALTLVVFGNDGPGDSLSTPSEIGLFLLTLPGWIAVAKLHGLYDRDEERADNSTVDDVVGVFHLVTIGVWVLLATCLVTGIAQPEMAKLIGLWCSAIVLVPLCRAVARASYRSSPSYVQNAVVLGAGDVGQLLARKFVKHPEYGVNVVGFVDSWPRERRADLPEHLTILGSPDALHDIIARLDVERIIVAFSDDPEPETLATVRGLRELNVQVDVVPRLYELISPRVGLHTVEGVPLVGLPPVRMTPSSRLFKRLVDVVGAAVALVLVAPLFAIIAWRVHRTSPGPVFFRQTRFGEDMRRFTVLKFRTMRVGADDGSHREFIRRTMSAEASADDAGTGIYKLDRSEALTPTGRWLRKTSLDELPQLINVLRGEMSLVGPRPCIPYETEGFQPHHFERFLVPQGITGLWQVTARANSTFGEALDMDVAYARGWSPGLDLRLILRTPLQLLRQRGATL